MRKKIKILILIIIIAILGGGLLFYFMNKGSKLTCELNSNFTDYNIKRTVIFNFDNKNKLNNYEEKYEYEYPTSKLAKKAYQDFDLEVFNINKNIIFGSIKFYVPLDSGFFIKNKKDVINVYVKQYGYTCK